MGKKKRTKDKKNRRRGEGLNRSQRNNLRKSESYVMAAQQAWDQQHYERATELYREALRRDPRNAELMVDLARAYGLRQDFQTANEFVERALRSDPKRAKIHYLAGQTYWMINRPDEAADCFQRVLELNPDYPQAPSALVTIARYHERNHRLEEAQEALDRAISLDPNHSEAKLERAILTRRSGKPSDAITQLHALLDDGPLPYQVESDAWYELAHLLDAQADYDAAFEALNRAKTILRPRSASLREKWEGVRTRNDRMLKTITADHFQRWHDEGPAGPPLRLALLTGHPRSGTTLVEQVLDSHPELVSADEFNTFSDWVFTPLGKRHSSTTAIPTMLDKTPTAALQKVRDEYWERTEAMLDEPVSGRLLMDKNPELTYLLPVANRVFPDMKVLFALRDPRDVVLSCFMQKLALNSVSINYLSLMEAAHKYAHVMQTWLTVRRWTKADWIEFRYEDTVADLEAQARRLLEFLGLPWDERVLEYHRHAQQKIVRSPTYEAVTKPIHSKAIGRWTNYERHFQPLLEILDPFLREFGYS